MGHPISNWIDCTPITIVFALSASLAPSASAALRTIRTACRDWPGGSPHHCALPVCLFSVPQGTYNRMVSRTRTVFRHCSLQDRELGRFLQHKLLGRCKSTNRWLRDQNRVKEYRIAMLGSHSSIYLPMNARSKIAGLASDKCRPVEGQDCIYSN